MKNFEMMGASQPADSDTQPSYFSNGLLSKIIHNDQQVVRPTEHILRRRWVKRMILAEFAFVLGVLLLQLFPVIEAPSLIAAETSSSPEPQITASATPTLSPATPTPVVAVATAVVGDTQSSQASAQPAVVPVALPNTAQDAQLYARIATASLLCIGAGLVLWLVAGITRSPTPSAASSRRCTHCADDQGSDV